MLTIFLLSALFYVNNKYNMSWGYTVTYDWGDTMKVRKYYPNLMIYNIYYKLLLSVGYWKLELKIYA